MIILAYKQHSFFENESGRQMQHEYLMNLAKDYGAKRVSTTDIDGRIKAEITKFIGHGGQAVIGTN